MADVAIAPVRNNGFRQLEFYAFSIIAFAGKSFLLIRLPYRPWYINTLYTGLLLAVLYCFFRFRQGMRFPPFVIFCLATAVGVDVMGNLFQLYGKPFGPLMTQRYLPAGGLITTSSRTSSAQVFHSCPRCGCSGLRRGAWDSGSLKDSCHFFR